MPIVQIGQIIFMQTKTHPHYRPTLFYRPPFQHYVFVIPLYNCIHPKQIDPTVPIYKYTWEPQCKNCLLVLISTYVYHIDK